MALFAFIAGVIVGRNWDTVVNYIKTWLQGQAQ